MTLTRQLVLTLTALFFTLIQTSYALPESIPRPLQTCLQQAIEDLMVTDRSSRTAVKALFLKNIDADRLGRTAVGGNTWKRADRAWREKALDMYFDLLFSKGNSLTDGMKDSRNTKITMKLAGRPEVPVGKGWHVVAGVNIDNGKHVSVALKVTPACKVFDFAQGDWASNWLDAGEVDRAMQTQGN